MLDIILKIMSVLGILLLALLALGLLALLLLLFLPVTYRIQGRREAVPPPAEGGAAETVPKAGGLELTAGMNWLFGFFRVRYAYPDPGILTVKILWFGLLRMKLPSDKKEAEEKRRGRKKGDGKPPGDKNKAETKKKEEKAARHEGDKERKGCAESPETAAQTPQAGGEESGNAEEKEPEEQQESDETTEPGGFLKKFRKIKYTLQGFYDKIKKIWQNISYYTTLLQKRATIQVFEHVKLRLFNILKNIRPRHIRADILFGTGEPDTTGCLYGVYTMFYPVLGDKCQVTPDFERKVLEGRFYVAGHITVFVLLVNTVKLVLDKKLRLFIRKMKREEKIEN